MKFVQKRYPHVVEIETGAEAFDYTIRTSGVKKRFAIDYLDFDGSEEAEIEETNTWWRNVGVLWVALGGVFMWMDYVNDRPRISIVFVLGLICLAVYRFGRVTFTQHTIDGGGRILLLKDSRAPMILEELFRRRRQRLEDVYGEIDFERDPEQEIAKFRWLESQGVFSRDQVDAKIRQIKDALADAPLLIPGEVN